VKTAFYNKSETYSNKMNDTLIFQHNIILKEKLG